MPENPDGFLRTYSYGHIFQSAHEPFWLERDTAKQFVRHSLDFRMRFDYNMQFSLVSRHLLDKMRRHGAFYQSPYPDYYASNAILLAAERVLVVPQPMVTIGISPKSFGFYYFNGAEATGSSFLRNLPDQETVARLQDITLPGSDMNNSWLVSMETLAMRFSEGLDLKVNYKRYRYIQICTVFSGLILGHESSTKVYKEIKEKMTFHEWVCFGLPFLFIAKISRGRFRKFFARRIISYTGSHLKNPMPDVPGKFKTMLDVYEQVNPDFYWKIHK